MASQSHPRTVHHQDPTEKLLRGLVSQENNQVYRSLVDIRTQYASGGGHKARSLIQGGLIPRLVALLERPNSKIVDVTLSILGNLSLHRKPREKLVEANGIQALYKILTTLNEENILGRGSRVVGNAGQDRDIRIKLLSVGVLGALVKNLAEVTSPAAKSSIVRAIRILGSHDQTRAREILSLNVLSTVSQCLHSDFEELLKSAVKCSATFSGMLCNYEMAAQIKGDEGKGYDRLVELCSHQKSSVWESALTTLVNLSQLEQLRPTLGNSKVVSALIDKIDQMGSSLRTPSYSKSVRALCLYSRESVNRMKLRINGGLKLFVRILSSREIADRDLHDCLINTIKNFAYDDASLTLLQNEGLVFALVKFVEDFVEKNYKLHSCEEEICQDDSAPSSVSRDDDIATILRPLEEAGPSSQPRPKRRPQLSFRVQTRSSTGAAASASGDPDDSLPLGATRLEDEEENTEKEQNVETTEVNVEQEINVEGEENTENVENIESVENTEENKNVEIEESKGDEDVRRKYFRVNSPSYQAVQDEIEAFSRLRNEYVCLSPPISSFTSTFSSPDRMSPSDSIRSSPYQSPDRSDQEFSDMEIDSSEDASNQAGIESNAARYSPVEFMSDDENENSDEPPPQANITPPRTRRMEPSAPLSPLQYFAPTSPVATSSPDLLGIINFPMIGPPSSDREKSKKSANSDDGHISEILVLLSRLAQFEIPHENLLNLRTSKSLIKYLCHTINPNSRAERILLKLSTNLYCLMPIIHQCQLSWIKLEVASRQSLPDTPCNSCKNLIDYTNKIIQNFSLLAETGYAEGVICHTLVTGILAEKQTIAVGIPILIRPRKLLRNVLLSHGGLDVLMEVLETNKMNNELFSHAVQSVKILSEHVGICSPELKLSESRDPGDKNPNCFFDKSRSEKDLTIKLDNGETVQANREILSSSSSVFEAMLSGQFAESSLGEISIKFSSRFAIVGLFHYLYGCRNCKFLRQMDINTLLELVALSDKYLLADFNRKLSGQIVQHCLVPEEVVGIYEKSLHTNYPVHGIDENLNICTTSFILVGTFPHSIRVSIFKELISSRMGSDFVDDITKTITEKL